MFYIRYTKVYCCCVLFLFLDSQPLARHIGGLDARYNSLFMDNFRKEAFEHSDTTIGKIEALFLLNCKNVFACENFVLPSI